jgi:cephalosporin hydroxylase
MEISSSYSHEIPNGIEYAKLREKWRRDLHEAIELRKEAIALTVLSNRFNYSYQWEWCGVPIIRNPDDIVLQQEIMWELRPSHVIETGVARGGSLVLSSSLIVMTGNESKVLGLDIQILPHAYAALKPWITKGQIELLECDSASKSAVDRVENFLMASDGPSLLVLDSNHSHEHVLDELNALAPLLPTGSIIMVADTIIEEMPSDYYPNRPWGRGNNPLTAVNKFLEFNKDYRIDTRWTRRSLMGECRDGILIRVANSNN